MDMSVHVNTNDVQIQCALKIFLHFKNEYCVLVKNVYVLFWKTDNYVFKAY